MSKAITGEICMLGLTSRSPYQNAIEDKIPNTKPIIRLRMKSMLILQIAIRS
jgi:hypothetical protein